MTILEAIRAVGADLKYDWYIQREAWEGYAIRVSLGLSELLDDQGNAFQPCLSDLLADDWKVFTFPDRTVVA